MKLFSVFNRNRRQTDRIQGLEWNQEWTDKRLLDFEIKQHAVNKAHAKSILLNTLLIALLCLLMLYIVKKKPQSIFLETN